MAHLSSGSAAASPDPQTQALADRLEELEAELATWREFFRILGVPVPQPRPALYAIQGGAA